jgi:hypothetical protein
MVNEFFGDYKIVDIFADFKNLQTGHPILPLRVQDGIISLEFYPTLTMKPNIFDLQHGVANIEQYLDKMLFLAKQIEILHQKALEENR